MIEYDVAPGVHRIEHGRTNCYQVDVDDRTLLVDAGFPRTWQQARRALAARSRHIDQIAGLVVTHGHFDHLGFAALLHSRHGVELWGHEDDRDLMVDPYCAWPQRPLGRYLFTHPRALPVQLSMMAAGAMSVPGRPAHHLFADGDVLDLPGRPRVVAAPGHTPGSSLLVLPDHGAVLTGDALVTLDPYTGRRGPRIVARAATVDRRRAMVSLERAAERVPSHFRVLPGHGAVWDGDFGSAVEQALRHGAA